MEITHSAVEYLNDLVETLDAKTPCLNVWIAGFEPAIQADHDMLSEFPEEFDIDWFSLKAPGWKFFVVFHHERLFDSTIDISNLEDANQQLVINVPGN